MGAVEWWSLTSEVMATTGFSAATLALVVLLVVSGSSGLPRHKRAPDAMAESGAEPIQAINGFYGNPLYRPYGFGAWGFGSAGYGSHRMIFRSPFYGGFYASG